VIFFRTCVADATKNLQCGDDRDSLGLPKCLIMPCGSLDLGIFPDPLGGGLHRFQSFKICDNGTLVLVFRLMSFRTERLRKNDMSVCSNVYTYCRNLKDQARLCSGHMIPMLRYKRMTIAPPKLEPDQRAV
jgi:hypothetical protein